MTRILLVRHGHVPGISPERFRGRADLPLTQEGRRQAELTARRLSVAWQPVAIYCSPLSRCRDTGAAIVRPFSLTPIPLAGLVDTDYGQWQGLTPEEARSRWPQEVDVWYRTPDQAKIPGGETLHEVRARVAADLDAVCVKHPADTIIMVGHDSVNRVILLHALGTSLAHYWRLRQSPCAINELEWGQGGFVIVSMNQTDHLRDADTT
ncbi:MAG: histidine phosphatase family protein, partial [Stellaceae bacterium]